jgi:hypothetical protein
MKISLDKTNTIVQPLKGESKVNIQISNIKLFNYSETN